MKEYQTYHQMKHTHKKKRRIPDRVFFMMISIVLIFFLLFSIAFKNKIFVTIFFTILSSIINFYTNMLFFRLDVGHETFFCFLLARLYGAPHAFFLLLISELIPDIYTARLDKDTIISIFFTSIMIWIFTLFPYIEFVKLGLILIVLKFIIGGTILVLLRIDAREIYFEWGINLLTNLFLFTSFGQLFFNFLN